MYMTKSCMHVESLGVCNSILIDTHSSSLTNKHSLHLDDLSLYIVRYKYSSMQLSNIQNYIIQVILSIVLLLSVAVT